MTNTRPDWDTLTGLDLRQRAAEVEGWRYLQETRWSVLAGCNPKAFDLEAVPARESDRGAAMEMLESVCQEHERHVAYMGQHRHAMGCRVSGVRPGAPDAGLAPAMPGDRWRVILEAERDERIRDCADGDTLPEAIARCVGEVLSAQHTLWLVKRRREGRDEQAG